MRSITVCYLIFLLVFSSCNFFSGGEGGSARSDTLPSSSGRIDEIVVVMDDAHWQDTSSTGIGEAVRKVLLANYKGLSQGEATFDISQVDPLNFHPLIRRVSNILYIGTLDGEGSTSKVLREQMKTLPEGKNPQNMYSAKDVWAKPQQVTYFFGQNDADLVKSLEAKQDKIIERLYKIENEKALRNVYASRVNGELTDILKKDFGIEFKVPNSFRFVKQTENSFWVRQDIEGEVSNLMIHSVPYKDEAQFSTEHATDARDEMGLLFFTDTPNSHMITDKRLDLVVDTLKLDDAEALESRGVWRMSKDYLGGPFVNYCIKDTKNKRLLVLDGSVFAPQWEKKRPIRKLENLIRTVKLL